jgi:hypothetical protein
MATAELPIRSFGLVRLGWGLVLLLRPGAVLTAISERDSTGEAGRYVVQLLGVREVLQGTVTALLPRRSLLRWGVAVDATHVVSMAGLAALVPGHAMPALTSAAIATIELAAGAGMARPVHTDRERSARSS